MQPTPQLAPFAQTIDLPALRTRVAYFDSAPNNAQLPNLILIHGLQDDADTWRHVFAPLANTHRVLAMDLPGFGRSDKAGQKYSPLFYASVVLAFMDTLHLTKAILIGNSLGAITAELVALQQPQRVQKLVLVSGTIRIVERLRRASTSLLRPLFVAYYDRKNFAALRQNPQAAYDTLYPFYADLNAMSQADKDFLFRRVNERVHDEQQRLASLVVQMGFVPAFIFQMPKYAKQIPALAVPAQVIWGDSDHIMPIRNGEERAAIQPNATFTKIAHAGHVPQQEQPSVFLSAIYQNDLLQSNDNS